MSREEFIKAKVKHMGYSLKSFSESIYMPYTTFISILNNGVGGAALENVIKICEGLGITIKELQSHKDENEVEITLIDTKHLLGLEESLIRIYRRFGSEEQERTLELLELFHNCSKKRQIEVIEHIQIHSAYSDNSNGGGNDSSPIVSGSRDEIGA